MSKDTPHQDKAALAVEGLTFHYGPRKALDNVSFGIDAGRTSILLGPNGAGKSTLFSLISGLFAPQAGRIAIAGRDLQRSGAAALAPLGIVFQAQTLDLDLTVEQNLRYFCALRGMGGREAGVRIREELDRFAMADRLGEKVRSLNAQLAWRPSRRKGWATKRMSSPEAGRSCRKVEGSRPLPLTGSGAAALPEMVPRFNACFQTASSRFSHVARTRARESPPGSGASVASISGSVRPPKSGRISGCWSDAVPS